MPFSATEAPPHNSGEFNFMPSSRWFPFNSNWRTRFIIADGAIIRCERAISSSAGLVLRSHEFVIFLRIALQRRRRESCRKCAFVADTRARFSSSILITQRTHTNSTSHCVLCCAQIKPHAAHTDDLVCVLCVYKSTNVETFFPRMCISAALEQHARPYFPSVGRKLRTFFCCGQVDKFKRSFGVLAHTSWRSICFADLRLLLLTTKWWLY